MAHVSHIYVEVQITEDDGSISVTEASGIPAVGTVECAIVPRHQTQFRRSTGQVLFADVVSVAVRLEGVLLPDGRTRIFGVDHEGKPVLRITQSSRPNESLHTCE
jgi:hypothetical protein